MTTLPPVIGYIRVASPAPGILAAAHQKQRIEQWAAETGREITQWVEDHGTPHASSGFDQAVADCRGQLIIAVDAARISRDLAVLQERAGQVRAAGGRLGFVEGWQGTDPLQEATAELLTIMAAHDEAQSGR